MTSNLSFISVLAATIKVIYKKYPHSNNNKNIDLIFYSDFNKRDTGHGFEKSGNGM